MSKVATAERNWAGLRAVDWASVTALFIVSRVVYALLGLRFDAAPLTSYMQFIDTELLQTRLWESIWYYHANPPLLNVFAGVGMKLFGSQAPLFFAISFHVLGLLVVLTVLVLTLRLSSSRVAAYLVTGLLAFSPAFVLYENWFMYSFPTAALLTVSALLLHRYVRTGETKWCAAFFVVLAALLLTRSLFHLAWLIMIALLLAAVLKGRRKQVLTAAVLPVLVVALWYGKNYVLFGTFSSSTWFGLGFSNISALLMTREELAPLVAKGELSEFALVSRYHQMDKLFTSQQLEPTGVPVLDRVRKSTGEFNFNSQQLIGINRLYTADGLHVVKRFPASYVMGLYISNRLFFSPSSMNLYFNDTNREAARPMEKIFSPVLYGVGAEPGLIRQPHFGFSDRSLLEVNTSIPLIVAWWLLLGYGYMQIRAALLSRNASAEPRAVVIGFIVVTVLYIYVVGTAFELAENYRYRWNVEPLMFVLAGTAITHLVRAGLRRLRRPVEAAEAGSA